MILEGLLTTRNADGSTNLAPMGPRLEEDPRVLVLRPFPGSKTFENLRRERLAVFHVTDDVELLARAALSDVPLPPHFACSAIDGQILADACRWMALQVTTWDEVGDRAELRCTVVAAGELRPFWGWNRAKHALLELAITATRRAWIAPDVIQRQLAECATAVDKTGGPAERRAYDFLRQVLEEPRA